MLVKLTPEDVFNAWDNIAPTIESSLAPIGLASETSLVEILSSILEEVAVCWAYVDGNNDVQGTLVTTILHDPILKTRSLLIYSAYGDGLGRDQIFEIIEYLKAEGRKRKCMFLSAFVSMDGFLTIAKASGGDAKLKYINWRL